MIQLLIAFLLLGFAAFGQEFSAKELTYTEFLGYVKKYHPLVKNANLDIN